jgi:probable HAF family extracellular repeat protein
MHSALGKALVLSAFALSLLVTAAGSFADRESGGEQRRGLHDELTFTQIDVPRASNTFALGINDRGQIIGNFFDAGGNRHGFLLDNDMFTQIDHPDGLTATSGINDRGQIGGAFEDAGGVFHGYLLDNGVFTQMTRMCRFSS